MIPGLFQKLMGTKQAISHLSSLMDQITFPPHQRMTKILHGLQKLPMEPLGVFSQNLVDSNKVGPMGQDLSGIHGVLQWKPVQLLGQQAACMVETEHSEMITCKEARKLLAAFLDIIESKVLLIIQIYKIIRGQLMAILNHM